MSPERSRQQARSEAAKKQQRSGKRAQGCAGLERDMGRGVHVRHYSRGRSNEKGFLIHLDRLKRTSCNTSRSDYRKLQAGLSIASEIAHKGPNA
jgi:hypothetical protein